MSVDKEIIKQVSRIEFSIRKILSGILIGSYSTAVRGQGMTFSDLRQYTPGDDIRNFAWQVMARTGEPFVKQFEEERDLEVHMALDIGASMLFGGSEYSKYLIQAFTLALVGLSASKLGDKFGVTLFADTMKKIIPTSKGEDHLRRSLLDYLEREDSASAVQDVSNVNVALKHFLRLKKKRCMCFLASDFVGEIDEKLLAMVKQRHSLIFVHVFDPYEQEMPKFGWFSYKSFTKEQKSFGQLNTNGLFFNDQQKKVFDEKLYKLSRLTRKMGIGLIQQSTHDVNMRELIKGMKLGSVRGFG